MRDLDPGAVDLMTDEEYRQLFPNLEHQAMMHELDEEDEDYNTRI